jgi:8-oxo-dGTP pyrophosphatase MutT (NUDIX family)
VDKYLFRIAPQGVVYRNDGKMLVMKRSLKEEVAPGTLAYIGGKVERQDIKDYKTETIYNVFEDTFIRECLEEAHVKVKRDSIRIIGDHLFERPDGIQMIIVTLIAEFDEQLDGDLDKDEVEAIYWLSLSEIDKNNMPEAVYRTYEKANKLITSMEN